MYNFYKLHAESEKTFLLASLRDGRYLPSAGGEGACVTKNLNKLYCNALSLSHLRCQLPPGGSQSMVKSYFTQSVSDIFILYLPRWGRLTRADIYLLK